MNKNYLYAFVAVILFCIDRATKYIALEYCAQETVSINQFLSYELVFNRGISWGLFDTHNALLFLLVSLSIALVTLCVGYHAYHLYRHNFSITGHVLILVGSLSNIIDRIYYGGVIDFILLSYKHYSWPVFNVADMAIVMGVIIIMLQCDVWLSRK